MAICLASSQNTSLHFWAAIAPALTSYWHSVPLVTFQEFLPSHRLPSLETDGATYISLQSLASIIPALNWEILRKYQMANLPRDKYASEQPHIFMGAIKLCCQRDKLM